MFSLGEGGEGFVEEARGSLRVCGRELERAVPQPDLSQYQRSYVRPGSAGGTVAVPQPGLGWEVEGAKQIK